VVISEKRSKRDGKYIDLLGYYNPCVKPAEFKIDEQKYQQWIQKGAQPTEAVKQLLTKVELSG
jgi:small subunit ribosomal protein S16